MYDIAHIGIVVSNIEKSKDFYCKVLGCSVIDTFEDEKLKAAFLSTGKGVLELLQYIGREGAVRETGAIDHIAFGVEDVDKAVDMLKRNNISLLFDSPRIVMGGTKKIMFFLGPDGERLEVIQEI